MSWKSKSYRGGGGGGGFAGEKRKQRSDYARRRAQTSGPSAPDDTGRKLDQMRDVAERDDALELEFGFARAEDSRKRLGFLINLQPVTLPAPSRTRSISHQLVFFFPSVGFFFFFFFCWLARVFLHRR